MPDRRSTAAWLGLGSNLGDRAAMLRAAVADLAADPSVVVVATSPIYETPPWGPVPQGPYLNACIGLRTTLTARPLLALCLAIERRHGRERTERWGPRTLDIDLLLFGEARIDEPGLVVPHPRMTERAFVLVPLAEAAPGLAVAGQPVEAWLGPLDASDVVERADLPSLLPAAG